MRISLKVGAATYPLAGASGVSERVHSSASGLRIAPTLQTAGYQILGAGYAERQDLGNVAWNISFSTTRAFSSPAEAEIYATDYEARLPRAGTLLMESIAPNGTVSGREMLNAIVNPPERNVVGATLFLNYSVEGGEIVPAAAVTLTANMPWAWTLQQWPTVSNQWQTL